MDEDTHLCLRCQQLVVGLTNYVNHRSRSCLPSAPPVEQSCWSQDTCPPESGDPLMSAPDFFQSLELKSAEPRPTSVPYFGQDRDTDSDPSEDELCQAREMRQGKAGHRSLLPQCDTSPPGGHTGGKWKPGFGQEHYEDEFYQSGSGKLDSRQDLTDDDINVSRSYSDTNWKPDTRSETAVESEVQPQQTEQRLELSEDDLYPPRSHTSGKWKPGTRPELTNEVWLVRSSSPDVGSLDVSSSNYLQDQSAADVDTEDPSSIRAQFTKTICRSRRRIVRNTILPKEYNCTQCNARFKDEKELGKHLFSPSHVGLSTSRASWLKEVLAFQAVFVRLLPFHCTLCSYYMILENNFLSHFSLNDHFKNSTNVLLCVICQHQCCTNEELLGHLASAVHKSTINKDHPVVITNAVTRLFCHFCGRKCRLLPRTFYSSNHEPVSGIKKRPGSSSICSTSSRPLPGVNAIKIRCRRNKTVKLYSCSQCSFQTVTKTRLERHTAIHINKRSRPFLCESCGMSFHERATLLTHARRHGKKSYRCPECHMTFHTRAEVENHRSRLHSEMRPHLCHVCGYSSKSRQQLLRHHRRLHTPTNNPCPHPGCQFTASLKQDLSRHLRIHTGEKPYKCPYCKYETAFQENLRNHILKTKKHSGKNVYPCKMCKFSTDDYLEFTSHSRQSHPTTEPTRQE